jgi:D-glycero-D-manno-heptose 1,7-bisphosphate phosphatase
VSSQKPAIFLDRDGVLNEMILNSQTGEYESPHFVNDVVITEGAYQALNDLQKYFDLFIVSNQPSFAKGKASLQQLAGVAEKIENLMKDHGVQFKKVYYCYHHPDATNPEMKQVCGCRKPGNSFLKDAAQNYEIDLSRSWMVGDRDIDIECGQTAGCRTVLIPYEFSKGRFGKSKPTCEAQNILEASEKILKLSEETIHG